MHNSNPKRNSNRKIFYISLLSAAILLTVLGIIGIQQNTKAPERSLASDTTDKTAESTSNNPSIPQAEMEFSSKSQSSIISEKEDNRKDATQATYPVLANNDTSIPESSISSKETGKIQGETKDGTDSKAAPENEGSTDTEKESDGNDKTTASEKNVSEKEASSQPATSASISASETPAPSIETAASALHFDQEKGLLWPVIGDVILNYSMEQGVYFKTLGQYKCNPAILIHAKKNTPVYAAADGIVEKIEKNDETGLTITCSIGDDFQVVYGQLKDVTVEEGDHVTEGQTLAKLAKPSNSYVLEENHLFFEVLEDGSPVDPMLLLR